MELAKRLALADSRVRRILGSVTRIVEAPAPWTSCGGKFVGADITIELFRPVSVDGDFPFVSFGAKKRGHVYAEGVVHLRADGITSLGVGVDLNRGRIVSIDPSGDDVRVRGHALVKPPVPAGNLDPAVCEPRD